MVEVVEVVEAAEEEAVGEEAVEVVEVEVEEAEVLAMVEVA